MVSQVKKYRPCNEKMISGIKNHMKFGFMFRLHTRPNLGKRFRQLKFLNVPFSKLLHRNLLGGCRYVVVNGIEQHFVQILDNYSFQPNLLHFHVMQCDSYQIDVVVVLQNYSSFLSFSAKLEKSSYQFQGHEDRSVHFATCVKVYAYFRKFELHRPAFMTLEPIR